MGQKICYDIRHYNAAQTAGSGKMFVESLRSLRIVREAGHRAGAGSARFRVCGFMAAILGAFALSLLELFVAFLQAYIFTFLSALFIGMAVHPH